MAYVKPDRPDLELDQIKARLAAATPGPWVPSSSYGGVVNPYMETKCGCVPHDGRTCTEVYGGRLVCESCARADAEFIAHARCDIEMLIGEIERLQRFHVDRR
jgi:hypothetical protein